MPTEKMSPVPLIIFEMGILLSNMYLVEHL